MPQSTPDPWEGAPAGRGGASGKCGRRVLPGTKDTSAPLLALTVSGAYLAGRGLDEAVVNRL